MTSAVETRSSVGGPVGSRALLIWPADMRVLLLDCLSRMEALRSFQVVYGLHLRPADSGSSSAAFTLVFSVLGPGPDALDRMRRCYDTGTYNGYCLCIWLLGYYGTLLRCYAAASLPRDFRVISPGRLFAFLESEYCYCRGSPAKVALSCLRGFIEALDDVKLAPGPWARDEEVLWARRAVEYQLTVVALRCGLVRSFLA